MKVTIKGDALKQILGAESIICPFCGHKKLFGKLKKDQELLFACVSEHIWSVHRGCGAYISVKRDRIAIKRKTDVYELYHLACPVPTVISAKIKNVLIINAPEFL